MACQAARQGRDSLQVEIGGVLPASSLTKTFLPFTTASQVVWCLWLFTFMSDSSLQTSGEGPGLDTVNPPQSVC